jgi:hypothetical protein
MVHYPIQKGKENTMSIKKLVVDEYEVLPGQEAVTYEVGYKYSYFVDQETGKHYRPKRGFSVTGDDLENLFEEVKEKERISG